jgi:recombination protein RecR
MSNLPLPLAKLLRRLGKLPGLGPRSAQRMALYLLTNREELAELQASLTEVAQALHSCHICGNLSLSDPCEICNDPQRERQVLCVVEQVADLWALERSGIFTGMYHVLGGVLNPLAGVGPEQLHTRGLLARVHADGVTEVILALSAGIDGQTTAQWLMQLLAGSGVAVSMLAKGMPVGAAVDYLDEGTLQLAMQNRQRQ